MRKRILAISLVLIMVICNSMTVWAKDTWSGNDTTKTYTKGTEADSADVTDGTSSGTKNVTAEIGVNSQGESYSVEITWGSLQFTPDEDDTLSGTWNDKGYYEVNGHSGGWEPVSTGANIITVTNKSNVNVTATFTPEISPDFIDDYILDPDNSTTELTVINDEVNVLSPLYAAQSGETNMIDTIVDVTATITRAPDVNTNIVTLGTVTVSLAKTGNL